jgi:hypothetical protein
VKTRQPIKKLEFVVNGTSNVKKRKIRRIKLLER